MAAKKVRHRMYDLQVMQLQVRAKRYRRRGLYALLLAVASGLLVLHLLMEPLLVIGPQIIVRPTTFETTSRKLLGLIALALPILGLGLVIARQYFGTVILIGYCILLVTTPAVFRMPLMIISALSFLSFVSLTIMSTLITMRVRRLRSDATQDANALESEAAFPRS